MAVATTTAIMLALAAAGAAASYQNTRQTAKRADNALASQIENQSKKSREADKRIRQSIDQQAASSPDDMKNKALSEYTAQLQATAPNATAGLQTMGGASDRYNQEAGEAALGIQKYGENQAGLQARIDAPRRQRDQEGYDRQRANNDLGMIERAARMRDFLDTLKTQNASRRNAGMDAFAGLASGASSAMGSGGGYSAAQMQAVNGAAPVGSSFFNNGGMAGIGW